MMLQMKKVPEKIIDEALMDIDEKLYSEILQKVLMQKINSLPDSLSSQEQVQKLLQFALQRGFLYDEISKTIRLLS